MAFESFGPTQATTNSPYTTAPEPLSQSGQLMGWGIYGALLVLGFGFGIVTGYERPKTIAVAKANKEKDDAKPDSPKSTPKPASTQESNPASTPTQPISTTPKDIPVTTPMVTIPAPKIEPKTPTPMVTTPKVDPKPTTPVTTTPPKTDPPKNDNLKPVSFKTDVLPILRTHCLNCHGAVGKPKGEVDLRTIASLMKSTSPNKMLVIGKPDESDFYTSITERGMPKDRTPPSEKEKLVLKNWILTGAKE